MTRYVALLRAVNVAGHNKVPMARLRELMTEAGFTDVATYVQSGNIVLGADAGSPAEVAATIGDVLRAELSIDVDVMVRNEKELAAVVAADPLGDVADDPAKQLVSFLSEAPDRQRASAVDPEEFLPERLALGDRVLYLWCPAGSGRSKLATAPWERRLGVRATTRNWRTVTTLLEMVRS